MSRKKNASKKAAVAKNAARKDPEKALKKTLKAKTAFGESKHADKLAGVDTGQKIYSYSTYENYLAEGRRFVRWCKEHTDAKTLDEMREHREDYIRDNLSRGLSAATVKKRVSALTKIYGDRPAVELPDRRRANITRSRRENTNSANFSEERNGPIVDFCRATGLRRHELAKVTTDMVQARDGRLWVVGVKGKGGRVRDVPVALGGEEAVLAAAYGRQPGERLWERIPAHMDVHACRADYCAAIYREHARGRDRIPPSQRYCCRRDLKGTWYDKAAMMEASRALGHSRIDVIAEHYLWTLD